MMAKNAIKINPYINPSPIKHLGLVFIFASNWSSEKAIRPTSSMYIK